MSSQIVLLVQKICECTQPQPIPKSPHQAGNILNFSQLSTTISCKAEHNSWFAVQQALDNNVQLYRKSQEHREVIVKEKKRENFTHACADSYTHKWLANNLLLKSIYSKTPWDQLTCTPGKMEKSKHKSS